MGCRFAGPLVLVFAALFTYRAAAEQLPVIQPTPGLVITSSVAIKPGTYRLPVDGDAPAIIVRGSNIVIDFQGAVIEGADPDADPDALHGTGIFVDGASRVSIRNAVVRGYKFGIEARGSPNLLLWRNDVSYNWKQRLHSIVEHESLLDWMSYHQNEKDEWKQFGAGMYLVDCDNASISYSTVRQGQNGLMITRSSGVAIFNNTFQFNSSLGIGLYRVTNSHILHNKIDWNVRGYSHGFFNRGQDSAGILMYEQSSNNVVAYNSVTHSGDGLFLWAGQTTMDSGKGGANDNLFYRNDFSHAPTNGIETTFSRNYFIENRVEENWHGVWGGYSWSSVFEGNRFSRNDEAMAIEHGQDNRISNNVFDGDRKAIRLWANDSQDPNWGYPKNRDTRSRNYDISDNTFKGHDVALEIDDTVDIALRGNTFDKVASRLVTTGTTDRLALSIPGVSVLADPMPVPKVPPPLENHIDAMIPEGARRGRDTIIVDEWGPYDFRSPKLWLAPPKAAPPAWVDANRAFPLGGLGAHKMRTDLALRLRVLGPEGTWKVARVTGGALSAQSGKVPGEVVFTPAPGAADQRVELVYTGAEIVTPRGRTIAAGTPYPFSFARFEPPVRWTARWYVWTEQADPLKAPDAFRKVLNGEPVLTETLHHLDFIGGRALRQNLPGDRVAMVAEAKVTLPPGPDGAYQLRVLSDDGVRVWVDGRLVIDNWDVHGTEVDTAAIAGGVHQVKVEYFEATGWAEFRLEFVRTR